MEEIKTPPTLRRVQTNHMALSDMTIIYRKKLKPSADLVADLSDEVSYWNTYGPREKTCFFGANSEHLSLDHVAYGIVCQSNHTLESIYTLESIFMVHFE